MKEYVEVLGRENWFSSLFKPGLIPDYTGKHLIYFVDRKALKTTIKHIVFYTHTHSHKN
jgi:hypothetical protein